MKELDPPLLERLDIPDRCRLCIALARVAATDAKLARNISELATDSLDGQMFDNLAAQLAKDLNLTLEEARAYIEAQRADVVDSAMLALRKLNTLRDQQLAIGQRIVEHCETGVRQFHPMSGIGDVVVEMCGSTTREAVQGSDEAEIVRVRRNATSD